jgi:hypothetical protein
VLKQMGGSFEQIRVLRNSMLHLQQLQPGHAAVAEFTEQYHWLQVCADEQAAAEFRATWDEVSAASAAAGGAGADDVPAAGSGLPLPMREVHLPDWQHLPEASQALQGVLKQMGGSFKQIWVLRNGMRCLQKRQQLQSDDAAVAEFRERYQYLQLCAENHENQQAAAEFLVTWDEMVAALTVGQSSG